MPTRRCLQENSTRLKAYRASLVVFPRRSKKPKQGDASKEEIVNASQKHGVLLPIEAPGMKQLETVTLTDEMKVGVLLSNCWRRAGGGQLPSSSPPCAAAADWRAGAGLWRLPAAQAGAHQ